MVYAMRNNRPIVSAVAINKKHSKNAHEVSLDKYASSHQISVRLDPSGEVVVKTNRIDGRK